ncbi:MAG: hypothetical protein ABL957_11920 [Parvularculaceae bacterium]
MAGHPEDKAAPARRGIRRIRPSLLILLALMAAEAAARLIGGYALTSLPLVRRDEVLSRQSGIVPLTFRSGQFGASRPQQTWLQRHGVLRWSIPPKVAGPAEWAAPDKPGEANALSFEYPPATLLPGGIATDGYGWRATGGEAKQGAIRVAFVGADFTFGEDDISLPALVQAELDRRTARTPGLRGRTFQVFNLGREGLDPEFFASKIAAEAAQARADFVIIENVEPFAAPVEFARFRGSNKRWIAFMNWAEYWAFNDSVMSRPRALSALYNSVIAPLREQTGKYEWQFDEATAGPEALKKSSDLNAAIAAAGDLGAVPIVLGARSVVRSGQTFPRDRRLLRLNWYRTERAISARHAEEVFKADAALARQAARAAGGGYIDLSPMAGRLRYFDDDLSLAYSGYRWAASVAASEILKRAQALSSE